MFTELDLSLARERRERLLREVKAARLAGRLRADRDSRFRSILPRWSAPRPAGDGRNGHKGVRLGDA